MMGFEPMTSSLPRKRSTSELPRLIKINGNEIDIRNNRYIIKLMYPKFRAGNGIRTRDPNLGRVVLYQLSYSRQ